MHVLKDIFQNLISNGYALIRCWRPELETEKVAQMLGPLLDVSSLLPNSHIPKIQTLRPRRQSLELNNQYSGTYGLKEFPLHSDLAHWQDPPRYFLLRCLVGSSSVSTVILPNSEVYSLVGETTVRRAVVRPRNNGRVTQICLLPVAFSKSGVNGLRWDSIFFVPMNIQATKIAKCISSDCLNNDALVSIQLINPGDTLIIDNWKVLHGRTAIQSSDMTRRIERVYLKEIGSVS